MDTLIEQYQNLANAIIQQAVIDYSKALRGNTAIDRRVVEECERFFRSEYFLILTDVDCERLISDIKKEVWI